MNSRAYTRIMVNEQETMVAKLRYMRQEMEKDEKQLDYLKNCLNKNDMPAKWTPYNHQELYD